LIYNISAPTIPVAIVVRTMNIIICDFYFISVSGTLFVAVTVMFPLSPWCWGSILTFQGGCIDALPLSYTQPS
jgi:hypothetical protein